MNLKKLLTNLGKCCRKNSPKILTGLGIAGFGSAIVITAKVAPKAKIAYDESKENGDDKWTTIKKVAPYYICPATIAITSAGAIIFSDKIQAKRQAAFASAYAASTEALKTYQKKVVEKLGNDKEKEIRQSIIQDDIKNGESPCEQIVTVNDNKMLCKDLYSGAFFRATPDELRKAEGKIKARLITEEFIPINEFYYLLDIPSTPAGEHSGWNIGIVNPMSDNCDLIEFAHSFAPDGVTPVLGVKFLDIGERIEYYGY